MDHFWIGGGGWAIKHVDETNNFVTVVHDVELQLQIYQQTFLNCPFTHPHYTRNFFFFLSIKLQTTCAPIRGERSVQIMDHL